MEFFNSLSFLPRCMSESIWLESSSIADGVIDPGSSSLIIDLFGVLTGEMSAIESESRKFFQAEPCRCS